jgi:hypothetical protein
MSVFVGNWRGLLLFMAAFGAAIGIGKTAGIQDEGLLMMIGGPLLAIGDLAHRAFTARGQWFARTGKTAVILWLPAWIWGAFWLVLGGANFFFKR